MSAFIRREMRGPVDRLLDLREPYYVSYYCQRLEKLIEFDKINELSPVEMRTAVSEINRVMFNLTSDIELAEERDRARPDSENFEPKENSEQWLRKITEMRKQLRLLHGALRTALKESTTKEENHALSKRRKAIRLHIYKQHVVDAFVDLVRDSLGDKETDEMMRRASTIAYEDIQDNEDPYKLYESHNLDLLLSDN